MIHQKLRVRRESELFSLEEVLLLVVNVLPLWHLEAQRSEVMLQTELEFTCQGRRHTSRHLSCVHYFFQRNYSLEDFFFFYWECQVTDRQQRLESSTI